MRRGAGRRPRAVVVSSRPRSKVTRGERKGRDGRSEGDAAVAGLAGLLVAVPILAVVRVLVRHILLGEVYGDPVSQSEPSGTVPSALEATSPLGKASP